MCGQQVEMRNTYRITCESLKERDNLEYLGVDNMIILKWGFKELEWMGVGWIYMN